MNRREVLAGILLTSSITDAGAQRIGKTFRIHPASPVSEMRPNGNIPFLRAVFQEMLRLGYAEGKNVIFERWSGEGRAAQITEVARSAVRSRPDLTIAVAYRVAQAVKAETTAIPVVAIATDRVALGLVASFSRSGGNITGVTPDAGLGIFEKRFEVLRAVVPTASKVAYLAPLGVWRDGSGLATRDAAERLGFALVGPPLGEPIQESEYRRFLAAAVREGAEALFVSEAPENLTFRSFIVELAAEGKLPAVYPYSEHAEVGGLLAYAVDLAELGRIAASYIDRILRGAQPGIFRCRPRQSSSSSSTSRPRRPSASTFSRPSSPAPTR